MRQRHGLWGTAIPYPISGIGLEDNTRSWTDSQRQIGEVWCESMISGLLCPRLLKSGHKAESSPLPATATSYGAWAGGKPETPRCPCPVPWVLAHRRLLKSTLRQLPHWELEILHLVALAEFPGHGGLAHLFWENTDRAVL